MGMDAREVLKLGWRKKFRKAAKKALNKIKKGIKQAVDKSKKNLIRPLAAVVCGTIGGIAFAPAGPLGIISGVLTGIYIGWNYDKVPKPKKPPEGDVERQASISAACEEPTQGDIRKEPPEELEDVRREIENLDKELSELMDRYAEECVDIPVFSESERAQRCHETERRMFEIYKEKNRLYKKES